MVQGGRRRGVLAVAGFVACIGFTVTLGATTSTAPALAPYKTNVVTRQSQPVLAKPIGTMQPRCGSELHDFPRVLHLSWPATANAKFYDVEIDCLHGTVVGKWDSQVSATHHVTVGRPATNTASYLFPGDNPGRWRVRPGWQVFAERQWGPWSDWCDFSFKTAKGSPGLQHRYSARIVSLDYAGNLAVNIHILIDDLNGISRYALRSPCCNNVPVQGLGAVFVPPLPTHIDRVVTVSHQAPDTVDRDHVWELTAEFPDAPEPVTEIAMEPKGVDGRHRCPGHYKP